MSAFRGPVWSALLQPFHDQSIQVEFMVAVGCPAWLTFDKDIADGSWVAADLGASRPENMYRCGLSRRHVSLSGS